MTQKQFGSAKSTGRKLDVIEEYLSMYQKALHHTEFRTIYIDGFAGSGEIPLDEHKDGLFDEDVKTILAGSADRALKVLPPFSRYFFIDQRKKCIDALRIKFKESPHADRVTYIVGDANDHICRICKEETWRSQRAVVLLDPFGGQVEWNTIEVIAATKALDLWYLFPAGLCVYRQIANDGTVHHTHSDSITRIVGTEAWKTAFLKPFKRDDLFGSSISHEKMVTPESAAEFMIGRLQTVFQGGVLDEMIPLGRLSYPSYYLLFAWSNPSKKATKLAKN